MYHLWQSNVLKLGSDYYSFFVLQNGNTVEASFASTGLFIALQTTLTFTMMFSAWCHSFNDFCSNPALVFGVIYNLCQVHSISDKFLSYTKEIFFSNCKHMGSHCLRVLLLWGTGPICVCGGFPYTLITVNGSHFNIKVLGSAVLINSNQKSLQPGSRVWMLTAAVLARLKLSEKGSSIATGRRWQNSSAKGKNKKPSNCSVSKASPPSLDELSWKANRCYALSVQLDLIGKEKISILIGENEIYCSMA